MNKLNKNSGFTLVEAAVVLVIIGLVLGGVIKATEFIDNARGDRFIIEMEGFQGAYHGYYSHRGEYPGDENDDKRIDIDVVGINDGSFFQDLYEVGLTVSPNPEVPLESAGVYFANFLPLNQATSLTEGTLLGKSQVCATLVKDKYARHLDSKLDDGIFNTGIVRSFNTYGAVERHTVCLQL